MRILRHNIKITIISKQKINYIFVKLKLSQIKCDMVQKISLHISVIPDFLSRLHLSFESKKFFKQLFKVKKTSEGLAVAVALNPKVGYTSRESPV